MNLRIWACGFDAGNLFGRLNSILLGILVIAGTASLRADSVDDYVNAEMKRQGIPGLSLAVAKRGKIVKAKGYGLANIEWQMPATVETVYQIQSITKQFTATAIMMLVEEGKIGLDEKLSAYLEGTPASWERVTIRHLLTHTSGIKDFINQPTASLRLDVTEEDVLRATASRDFNFPTGERYAYSNTGYHLLAMVIRKVTGKFYGDFLKERIFDPLGMKNTRIISWREIIPHRAAGYSRQDGQWRNGEYVAGSILGYGGGGIRSTVVDMVAWDAALYGEKLLKRSSLETMWQPGTLNNGSKTSYGFGWAIDDFWGHRNVNHSGGHVTGFSTEIDRFVDDGLTVIVFANGRPSNPGRITRRVAGFYDPALSPPARKVIKMQPKAFSDFTGRYEAAPNSMATLTAGRGRLLAHYEATGPDEFRPTGKDEFYNREEGATLNFLRDQAGQVTNLVINYNKSIRNALKVGPLFKDLATRADPNPERTERLRALLVTLGKEGSCGVDPKLITKGAIQAFAEQQESLEGVASWAFVGMEEVANPFPRHGSQVARIVYFKGTSAKGERRLLVHLTAGGEFTDLDVVTE